MITIIIAHICLIFAFSFIIGILASQLSRLYKLTDKEGFCSVITSIIVLIITLILFFKYQLIARSPNDVLIILIVSILFGFFGIYNLILYVYNKFHNSDIRKNPEMENISLENKNRYYEFLRKSFHFIIFAGIMAFLIISYLVLNWLYSNNGDPLVLGLIQTYWGPDIQYPINVYIENSTLATAGIFMLAFFIISSGIIVMNEAARLIPKIYFPFAKAASFFLREKERDNFASYLYFSIGMVFSSLILTTLPILAILATLSFGDSSYALIGKRFGKHKIPFNKIKSIEGSIGGFLVTFICTLPLVGILFGLIAAIIFTLIDIVTPRIPMCDNIMGPVLITIAFWIMGVIGLKIGGLIVLLI
ncbi:MAG: hypothetical protein EU551_02810 [Promethearchaeota archaeon]|nr:MAG: hypothetical protein EU551_02810 [Candidatus Lokiarchaeota archaeon]